MNIVNELEAICSQLEVGVLDADRMKKLLRDSELENRNSALSFHRAGQQAEIKDQPKGVPLRTSSEDRCEVKDQIVIQLRKLSRQKSSKDRDQIAIQNAARMRGLLREFVAEYGTAVEACIDDVVGGKFRRVWKSNQSQNIKADAIASAVGIEWEQFKALHGIRKEKRAYFYKLVLDCDGGNPPKWLGNLK